MPKLKDILGYDAKVLASLTDEELRILLQPQIDVIKNIKPREKVVPTALKHLSSNVPKPKADPKPRKLSAKEQMKLKLAQITKELEEDENQSN